MRRRRIVGVAVGAAMLLTAAVAIAVVVGPAAGPQTSASPSTSAGPRTLTVEESERLATVRFLAYQDGSRSFRTAVAVDGATVQLYGRVDYRAGVGIASVATGVDNAIAMWNATTLVGWTGVGSDTEIPAQAPTEPGGARALDTTASSIDTVLALVLALGADRPENAQLLQQSDAAWLRADEIDGVPVDVFAGPSDSDSGEGGGTVRYWVDEDGAARRVEADLPGGTIVVDLGIEDLVAVAPAPQLG